MRYNGREMISTNDDFDLYLVVYTEDKRVNSYIFCQFIFKDKRTGEIFEKREISPTKYSVCVRLFNKIGARMIPLDEVPYEISKL